MDLDLLPLVLIVTPIVLGIIILVIGVIFFAVVLPPAKRALAEKKRHQQEAEGLSGGHDSWSAGDDDGAGPTAADGAPPAE